MRSVLWATLIVSATVAVTGCDDQPFASSDCRAQMDAARRNISGAVTDSTIVSATDKQLGWFYDDGSGTPMSHRFDFNWSSGSCVVTPLT
jgi:hypothetical protein